MSSENQPDPPKVDVIVYNAPITYDGYYQVLELCRKAVNENVLLMLTTGGGDPNAAYRIARSLGGTYKKVTAYITSFCKSAGTLVVLGADEIVIGDAGELGPLDIQIRKKNELLERWSGNDLAQGLASAMQHALQAYRETFLEVCFGAGLSATIGADAAANVVTGLYGQIFAQIDPSRLGEIARANQISMAYAKRLIGQRGIEHAVDMEDTLRRLVFEYPAHAFVIDRKEAEGMFSNVRAPTDSEQQLANHLLDLIREPRGSLSEPEPGIITRIFPPEEPDNEDSTATREQSAVPPVGDQDGGGCGQPSSAEGGASDGDGDVERSEGNGPTDDASSAV